jgi:hypothetical protein
MSKFFALVTAICVVIFWVFMALRPANASWQLIPGQPYDGNSRMWGGGPKGNHKEPCWSAATSKCAYEQSRQNQGQQNRAKTRGSR